MTVAEKILAFNKSLHITASLPQYVEVMNPFQDKTAFALSSQFYKKYYSDDAPRTMIVGINPGRHGGGITGVPFTDPVKLQTLCGINNDLPKKVELSADFIYRMIEGFGGIEKFYSKFYISAISPLGFTKDGKNLNYYDIKELQAAIMDFIIDCIQKQLKFGVNPKVCYCLGEGENYKFLFKLNARHKFFGSIIPLPHPRFIMQYRRKRIDEFVKIYVDKLTI